MENCSSQDSWEDVALKLTRSTEAAALAAWPFRGRGDGAGADAAAAEAMRAALTRWGAPLRVLTGEGEKDGAHHVAHGERFGPAAISGGELALDPIDGTTRLCSGRAGALSAAAIVPHSGAFDPGPSHYMEKIVCSAAAASALDPEAPAAELAGQVARALGKPLRELCVFVLDKPRHAELVTQLRDVGIQIAHHDAGDLEAALLAAIPDSGIDLVLGIGGTPEGIVSACGVRALGGQFYSRLAPQRAAEREALAARALYPSPWRSIDQLITAPRSACCVTGITACQLVNGIARKGPLLLTETLLFCGETDQAQVAPLRIQRAHPTCT